MKDWYPCLCATGCAIVGWCFTVQKDGRTYSHWTRGQSPPGKILVGTYRCIGCCERGMDYVDESNGRDVMDDDLRAIVLRSAR